MYKISTHFNPLITVLKYSTATVTANKYNKHIKCVE